MSNRVYLTPDRLVIGKPGIDVVTNTNRNNLLFSSDQSAYRHYMQGSFIMEAGSNGLGNLPIDYHWVTFGETLSTVPFLTGSIAGRWAAEDVPNETPLEDVWWHLGRSKGNDPYAWIYAEVGTTFLRFYCGPDSVTDDVEVRWTLWQLT
jgi:hypothetical protein